MLHHQLQCFSGLRVDNNTCFFCSAGAPVQDPLVDLLDEGMSFASVVCAWFIAVNRLLMKSSLPFFRLSDICSSRYIPDEKLSIQ